MKTDKQAANQSPRHAHAGNAGPLYYPPSCKYFSQTAKLYREQHPGMITSFKSLRPPLTKTAPLNESHTSRHFGKAPEGGGTASLLVEVGRG